MTLPADPAALELSAQPLTQQAFARFGDVIEMPGTQPETINAGSAQRFDMPGAIHVLQDRQPVVSLFIGQPFSMPVTISRMECHPLGSQLFMPLDSRPYLVVVAESLPDGSPATPVAFVAGPGQGVVYPPGRWHHPLLSLEAVSRFLVVDGGGDAANLKVASLRHACRVSYP